MWYLELRGYMVFNITIVVKAVIIVLFAFQCLLESIEINYHNFIH